MDQSSENGNCIIVRPGPACCLSAYLYHGDFAFDSTSHHYYCRSPIIVLLRLISPKHQVPPGSGKEHSTYLFFSFPLHGPTMAPLGSGPTFICLPSCPSHTMHQTRASSFTTCVEFPKHTCTARCMTTRPQEHELSLPLSR